MLLGAGCGLIAYAGVDREPGPGYLGFVVLASFVLIAGPDARDGASILGWPLVLLLLGGALLVIGLRPRRELPPEPGPEETPDVTRLPRP